MKSPQERPNGQLPIFSKEELDAAANPPKEKLPEEKREPVLDQEGMDELYRDNDEDRKKYWNR